MRNIVTGDYYHIYSRAAHRITLFRDTKDYARFLFGLLHYQSPLLFPQAGRYVRGYDPLTGFPIKDKDFENILRARGVELVAFCIMGNHYHLIARELVEGGISRYMHRVNEAYAKYYNAKYDSSGHVFAGSFNSKHIAENEYLTHLSAYIHKNPADVKNWKGREEEYPWSSLQDYTKENRWGGLLATEIILDQFEGTLKSNYADFVKQYDSNKKVPHMWDF